MQKQIIVGETLKINDKLYKKRWLIGEGAKGQVYFALDQTGQQYAIKKIFNYRREQRAVKRQIQIQRALRGSKYIVQYYGSTVNQEGLIAYIVFQLGQCSLRNQLQQREELTQNSFCAMLMNISQGLSLIHQMKYVHRDIKPQNIIVKNGVYKITDFGISFNIDRTLVNAGTLLYMPPEQVIWNQSDDINNEIYQSHAFLLKFDVWSLGVMAFEAYFGIHPFFYANIQKMLHRREVEKQLGSNIKILCKDFSIQKLIEHLTKLGKIQLAKRIQLKSSFAKPQLKLLLAKMLEYYPQQRVDMNFVLTTLKKLQGNLVIPPQKVKVVDNSYSFDISFFVQTLNLFYQLNVELPSDQATWIQYYLQASIWFIQKNYQHQYIQKKHAQQIKANKSKISKDTKKFWDQTRQCLFKYFFQLKKAKFNCFQSINQLRFRILLCSCWNVVIYNQKPLGKFMNKNLYPDIQCLRDICEMVSLYCDLKDISKVEDFILDKLYAIR